MEKIKKFLKDEDGLSAVEYGLLAALMGGVVIAAVSALNTDITTLFTNAGAAIKAPKLTIL